jgi:hypothetical protein
MRALLILSLFIFNSFSANPRHSNDHLIYWSADRRLTWDDFTLHPKKQGGGYAALTSSTIHSSFNTNPAEICVVGYFSSKESWVCSDQKTEDILKHEQGHFDLTEIYARMFRKQVMAATFTFKNLKDKYNKIHTEIISGWNKEQVLYDKETEHGIDSTKQHAWLKDIANRLDELKAYSDTLINIKL